MNPPMNPHRTIFPNSQPFQTSSTTQNNDATSTHTSLTQLLSLTTQTLKSLSFLQIKPPNFATCPHNPNHLIPHESLFLHTLHCPFPISANPSSLLSSLHYPKTLNLKNPIHDSQSTDQCVSLEGYFSEFGSNFYYEDCPNVVEFKSVDLFKKDCELPSFLSVECGDFVSGISDVVFSGNEFRILASELWRLKSEVESWVDFPVMYSYSVLCAVLRLNFISERDLRRWIIVGSQQFGVVIDVFMRDHINVLFVICLKAIRKEGLDLVHSFRGTGSSSIKCPVLFRALMWVASQLSVLYGAVNAKYFVVQVFRQCVLWAANEALLAPAAEFSLTISSVGTGGAEDKKSEQFPEVGRQDKVGDQEDRNLDEVVIFVSQVVAAVAALHERSLLEAKIKQLRNHQPLSRYQRMSEHEDVTRRAEDERKKRPKCRAIIDHDGLLRRRSSDQESNETKTREQLLAEERDYKRRRMSYRGKKVKRTTLQVMRDVIDEYMEEIRESGGIGCFDKGDEEDGLHPERPSVSCPEDLSKSTDENSKLKDLTVCDFERHRQGHDHHREPLGYSTSTSQDGNAWEHSSGSPRIKSSYSFLHGRGSIKRDHDDVEPTGKKHERKLYMKRTYKDGRKSHSRDRSPNSLYDNRSSRTKGKSAFADRYDPADSQNNEEEIYFTYSDATNT